MARSAHRWLAALSTLLVLGCAGEAPPLEVRGRADGRTAVVEVMGADLSGAEVRAPRSPETSSTTACARAPPGSTWALRWASWSPSSCSTGAPWAPFLSIPSTRPAPLEDAGGSTLATERLEPGADRRVLVFWARKDAPAAVRLAAPAGAEPARLALGERPGP